MPANTKFPVCEQPSDPEISVYRYMNLAKLVNLITTSRLYLINLNYLEDSAEGTFDPSTRAAMIADYETRRTEQEAFLKSRGIENFPSNPVENLERSLKSGCYVNCWCIQQYESEALWRIYGGEYGVAIRTTYQQLALALPSHCMMGKVKYYDPSTEKIPLENFLNIAMHKRHFFKHEHECRIFHFDGTGMGETPVGYDKNSPRPIAISAQVDLKIAKLEVIPSPLAPPWYFDTVAKLLSAISSPCTIAESVMK
ncbi:MAG: hypothetical protein ACI89L_001077 [Phycisphaerales bacterium]|jgi:hypothetical protein